MFKAHEATLLWHACIALIGLDDGQDRRQRDVLTWTAELIGRSRSSLGKWTSPRGDNSITTWGLRGFRQAFARFGKADVWGDFETQILSEPFPRRSDNGGPRP